MGSLFYKINQLFYNKYICNVFFTCFIFLILPINLLWENRGEYNNNLLLLLPSFLVFFISLFFLSSKKINNLFLFFALYVVLKNTFSDLPVEKLSGLESEKNNIFNYKFFFEFIFIFILFLFYKFRKQFTYKFVKILLIILLSNSLFQVSVLIKNNIYKSNKNFNNFSIDEKKENINVYLITFDALSSYYLEDFFKKPKNREDFNNFNFFENNHSNYTNTGLSVPSFLSGQLIQSNHKINDFRNEFKKSGLFFFLKQKGYKISQYIQGTTLLSNYTDYHVSHTNLLKKKFLKKYYLDFYDLVIINIIPNIFTKFYYKENLGFLSKTFGGLQSLISLEHQRAIGASLLIKKLIEDESNRDGFNNFIHAHIYLPHGPYVLNNNGKYISLDNEKFYNKSKRERYNLQSDYVLSEIKKFLDTLKKTNKFKNSLIIINSDTGSWTIGPKNGVYHKSEDLSNNVRFYRTENILNQVRSSLLIKFPKDDNKFQFRNDLSQLLDIFPTVLSFIDDKKYNEIKEKYNGINLQKNKRDKRKKIFFSMGYKQRKGPNSKWVYLDKKKGEKKMNQYSFSLNNGYKIEKDIIVK